MLGCVHTVPAHFENDRKFNSKKTLHDFDAKEMYLHSMNRLVSFQRRREMFCFSKSTVFNFSKIYRQKMCRFRLNAVVLYHSKANVDVKSPLAKSFIIDLDSEIRKMLVKGFYCNANSTFDSGP